MTRAFLVFALLAGLPALAVAQNLTPEQELARGWRRVATDDDERRLRDVRRAWDRGLAGARDESAGQAEVTAEGPLLDPDVALTEPAPPPGDYECRTIKLGSQSRSVAFVAYPAVPCTIYPGQVGTLSFIKTGDAQRPIGRFYPDNDLRMVFLGTLQLGDEVRSYQYGLDRDRDMAGYVQRVGPNRWRLVLPYPHFESLLDVIELVPRR
jgi:hypothetical protein